DRLRAIVGGSAETLLTLVAVSPTGPVPGSAVTIATPAGCVPKALRKSWDISAGRVRVGTAVIVFIGVLFLSRALLEQGRFLEAEEVPVGIRGGQACEVLTDLLENNGSAGDVTGADMHVAE